MNWVYVWLIVFAVCLIFEFVTFEMVSIWVCVGALVAMLLAFCHVPYEIQIIVAIAVSILCIIFLRKFTLKFLSKNKDKTNIDENIGKKVTLIKKITAEEPGLIKINGIEWHAVSENNEEIKENEKVEIVRVEGNKFVVKKID